MMRYKLVIAEKPSVAQSLAAVIGATARKDGYLEGNGWRVSWCVGHLAGLADADSYDPKYAKWRYDDLPILPEHWQMVVGKDKKKQFDILKKLMNAPDVTEVVNACDAGREGRVPHRNRPLQVCGARRGRVHQDGGQRGLLGRHTQDEVSGDARCARDLPALRSAGDR